jgi:phosphoglucomutase
VVDLDRIRQAGLRLAVDPLGGAGVAYWIAIAERYGLDLSLLDEALDPTFREIPPGADGQIRTDPSSPAAVARLVALVSAGGPYDLGFACDADHDRHGIVTPVGGLMPANAYLATAVDHLLRHRPAWRTRQALGRSVVTTRLIDRIAATHGRTVFDVPVGFKWFASGLRTGHLALGCEESAGLSFVRRDGSVWTTDKDGITAALLAAEITALTGQDPAQRYRHITRALGEPLSQRTDLAASAATRDALGHSSAEQLDPALTRELGGEPVTLCMSRAPGNGAPLGGLVLEARSGWIAVRPSGTEAVCKLYAESFVDERHLALLMAHAQAVVHAIGAGQAGQAQVTAPAPVPPAAPGPPNTEPHWPAHSPAWNPAA